MNKTIGSLVGIVASQLPVIFGKNGENSADGSILVYLLFISSVIALIIIGVFYKEENRRREDESLRVSMEGSYNEGYRTALNDQEEPLLNPENVNVTINDQPVLENQTDSRNNSLVGALPILPQNNNFNNSLEDRRLRRMSMPTLKRQMDCSHESLPMDDESRTDFSYSDTEESYSSVSNQSN